MAKDKGQRPVHNIVQVAIQYNNNNTNNSNNNNNTTNVEEPVKVMKKDTKKVAQGERLAESNSRKKEELTQKSKAQESEPKLSQVYGVGAVIAVEALGLLGYYIYQSSSLKEDNNTTKSKH